MSVSICHTDHPDHSRIADWLLLNGTLTACPGLLHGKLGIAIFFFHYARFTGEELFDEYAWDLVVAMQEQLHANYRPDYEWGIAGIGVGIDYLIRSGLIEVDEDFFEDLDERMYRADRLRMVLALSPGECGGRGLLVADRRPDRARSGRFLSRRDTGCSSFSARLCRASGSG